MSWNVSVCCGKDQDIAFITLLSFLTSQEITVR